MSVDENVEILSKQNSNSLEAKCDSLEAKSPCKQREKSLPLTTPSKERNITRHYQPSFNELPDMCHGGVFSPSVGSPQHEECRQEIVHENAENIRDWVTAWVDFSERVIGFRPRLTRGQYLATENAAKTIRPAFKDLATFTHFLLMLEKQNPGKNHSFDGWAYASAGKLMTLVGNLHIIQRMIKLQPVGGEYKPTGCAADPNFMSGYYDWLDYQEGG